MLYSVYGLFSLIFFSGGVDGKQIVEISANSEFSRWYALVV